MINSFKVTKSDITNLLISILIFSSVLHKVKLGPLRISQIVTIVILIILGIMYKKKFIYSMKYTNKKLYFILINYIFINILSSLFFAANKSDSFRMIIWLCFDLITFFTMDIAYVLSSDKKKYSELGIKVFLSVGLLEALYGLISYAMYTIGINIGGNRIEPTFNLLAITGTFTEHNIYASYIVMIISIIYSKFMNNKTSNIKITLKFVILGIALILGMSRGPWLSFIISIFIINLLYKIYNIDNKISRKKQIKHFLLKYTIAMSIILFSLFIFNTNNIKFIEMRESIFIKIENMFNVSSGTGGFRSNINNKAINDWSKSKLIGLGTNSYGQRHFMKVYGEIIPEYLPNLWIGMLHDSGVVGLLLFLYFIYQIMKTLRKSMKLSEYKEIIIGGMAGIVGISICYITTNAMWFDTSWIYIAIIVNISRLNGLNK